MKLAAVLAVCLLLTQAVLQANALRWNFLLNWNELRPRQPAPPSWPASYSLKYTFSLPYTSEIQSDMVTYDVSFFRDDNGDDDGPRARMEVNDASNVLIATKHEQYELIPRLDRQICRVFTNIAPDESIAGSQALPDIAGGGWDFLGAVGYQGDDRAELWQYERHHEAKLVQYKLWISSDGAPLRLHMLGNDLLSGAHYDEWVVDYTEFKPGRPDPSLFDKPRDQECSTVPGDDDDENTATVNSLNNSKTTTTTTTSGNSLFGTKASASSSRMLSLLPRVRYGGDQGYDNFLATHGVGRRHASLADYRRRLSIFTSNNAMIESHNAANRSFTMAMNKFGDWTREERFAVLLPKRLRKKINTDALLQQGQRQFQGNEGGYPLNTDVEQQTHRIESNTDTFAHRHRRHSDHDGATRRHELPYVPLVDVSKIPSSVDWRGSGADGGGVRDQANCGSCWAFGAIGAMESAWYMATGQSVSFSAQQVMDCSWGYVKHHEESASACDGGDAWAGVGHIIEAGGIALSEVYQYLGVGDYCKDGSVDRNKQQQQQQQQPPPQQQEAKEQLSAPLPPLVGRFRGYMRLPQYDDLALMEAIYSRGPVAVSLDASQDSFTFYSAGVYYDSNCMYRPEDLDHSMMAVGYGTDDAGEYWLIRNSWSTHWGDEGYVKVSRDNRGCGAATDALVAVVDEGGGVGVERESR